MRGYDYQLSLHQYSRCCLADGSLGRKGLLNPSFHKLAELVVIAIEDIDIHKSVDAIHLAILAELPDGQPDVGLVLSIPGYPDGIILLYVGSQGKIAVDKHLTHVENRSGACVLFYGSEPCFDIGPHDADAPTGFDLLFCGFHVQDWRHVAFVEAAVAQKEACLV